MTISDTAKHSRGLPLDHLLGDEAGLPFMPYRNVN